MQTTIKPWPHRASVSASASASTSVSALTLASMLENGYDVDAWCALSKYRSMTAITNVNADVDAQFG